MPPSQQACLLAAVPAAKANVFKSKVAMVKLPVVPKPEMERYDCMKVLEIVVVNVCVSEVEHPLAASLELMVIDPVTV